MPRVTSSIPLLVCAAQGLAALVGRAAHRAQLILAMVLLLSTARAGDLADEADLRFQLGTETYQSGNYRGALEHFLASNRLVPNHNVVFNIARTFEQLQRFPEAFRYYTQALEAEPDAKARAELQASLSRIGPNVAVLRVLTSPAGARLYLDRRDLGPRGDSPRTFGLAAGRYRVLAELNGYEPAEAVVDAAEVGQTFHLHLKLVPMVGQVQIAGPAGAAVRVDDSTKTPRCTAPCTLELRAGPHTLFVEQAGHRRADIPVDVAARRTATLHPQLQMLTGTVLVSTDVPAALIEVNGQPQGFTPHIQKLPVGEHRVRLSLKGFRAVERAVVIRHAERTRLDVSLTQSEEVIAASRVSEAVEDAPNSVSIIPLRELRALAYPTLAEALRGTRGLYVWDDRAYVALGMRGLGRLGSYGTRLLVLHDGHPLNDNWVGASFVGYDAMTDLEDVERIEVVRGPGSALYGTGAFSGVVNVVTRGREERPGTRVGVSTNLGGVARARARSDVRLGAESGAWMSVAGARGEGRDFYFPEYAQDSPPELAGHARGIDGFEAGTLRGATWWRWMTARWFYNSHRKQLPTAHYETLFGDPRERQTDTRAFLELRADPQVSDSVRLMSRAHLNQFRFYGFYPLAAADGGPEVDTYRGAWVGLEQRLRWQLTRALTLTAGGEAQFHYQVQQRARNDDGYFLDDSGADERTYQVGAGYLIGDAQLGSAVRVSAGARVDTYSELFGSSVNPRAGVIIRPYEGGNLKLIGAKAFRAPSVYELYYNDAGDTQIASPTLEPESIYSGELEFSHRFSPTVSATASTYGNYVHDLIAVGGSGDDVDPLFYYNSTAPLVTFGGEFELRRDWRRGWMVAASYGLSHARYLEDESPEAFWSLRSDPQRRNVANAPTHLASVKGAVPIIGHGLGAATRLSLEGPRWDRFEDVGDARQEQTDPAVVWDIVLTGRELRWGLSYAFGVYNAFDWRYSLPVSDELRQRTIPQAGRTFLASAELAF